MNSHIILKSGIFARQIEMASFFSRASLTGPENLHGPEPDVSAGIALVKK